MIDSDFAKDEYLREFMYHASVGVVQTDVSGRVVLLNPVAVQLLMPLAARGDFLTNLWRTLEPFVPELTPILDSAPERTGSLLKGLRIMLPPGAHGQADTVCLSLSIVKVGRDALITTIADVSEMIKYERLLGKQEARLNATTVAATMHAQVVLAADGKIATWNAAIQRLTGFSAEQMIGRPCSELFVPDAITPEWISDRLIEVERTGISYAEGHLKRADGGQFWGQSILVCIEPSLRSDGYTLLLRDAGDHRETIDSLLKAVKSDQLTCVANRRGLHEAAELEFKRHAIKPRDIALLLIDIDYFKQINDTYGHPIGDQVLRHLASAMLLSVRDIDVVARLGGEEFAVLLPSTDLPMAVNVAERIRSRIASHRFKAGEREIPYRVSIGVAKLDRHMTSLDELIAAADLALYDAKRTGRDRVCIAPGND